MSQRRHDILLPTERRQAWQRRQGERDERFRQIVLARRIARGETVANEDSLGDSLGIRVITNPAEKERIARELEAELARKNASLPPKPTLEKKPATPIVIKTGREKPAGKRALAAMQMQEEAKRQAAIEQVEAEIETIPRPVEENLADRVWSGEEIKEKAEEQARAMKVFYASLPKPVVTHSDEPVIEKKDADPIANRRQATRKQEHVNRKPGELLISDLYLHYGLHWAKLLRILPAALAELGLPTEKARLEHIIYPPEIKAVLERQNPELRLEAIDPEHWYSINRIVKELRDGDYCDAYQTAETTMTGIERNALAALNQIIDTPEIENPILLGAVLHLRSMVTSRPITIPDVCRQFRKEKKAYHVSMYILMMPLIKERLGKFEDKPENEMLIPEIIAALANDFQTELPNFKPAVMRIIQRLQRQKDSRVRQRKIRGYSGNIFCCDPEIVEYMKNSDSLQKFRK